MTSPAAEERARAVLAAHVPNSWRDGIVSGANNDWGHIRPSEAIRALIAHEAAAIERAAQVCLQVSGLIGAGAGSSIDSALREAAQSIRALAGGEAASDG